MAELKQARPVPPNRSTWFGRLKQRFPILEKKRGVALVIGIMILPLFGLLGLLALRNHGAGGGAAAAASGDLITDDTYFYGQSEPVYPSPPMTGSGAWADAYNKAVEFVKQLTVEEKPGFRCAVVHGHHGNSERLLRQHCRDPQTELLGSLPHGRRPRRARCRFRQWLPERCTRGCQLEPGPSS
ncbi:hypothetical protein F4810DRAFT_371184 [Camillea tinctor]|nr:hypothetical protein F4810DRAFT_371184 [Camillea tinctor]